MNFNFYKSIKIAVLIFITIMIYQTTSELKNSLKSQYIQNLRTKGVHMESFDLRYSLERKINFLNENLDQFRNDTDRKVRLLAQRLKDLESKPACEAAK